MEMPVRTWPSELTPIPIEPEGFGRGAGAFGAFGHGLLDRDRLGGAGGDKQCRYHPEPLHGATFSRMQSSVASTDMDGTVAGTIRV